MTFSIRKKLQSLDAQSLVDVEGRFQQLSAALQQKGHSGKIRDDSRLCYKWAVGESIMDQDQIIDEMVRMQDLFENTTYAQVSQKVVDLVIKDLICLHGLDTLQAQILAKRHMVPAAKAVYVV